MTSGRVGFIRNDRWRVYVGHMVVVHEYAEVVPRASQTMRPSGLDLPIPLTASESVRRENRPHSWYSSYSDLRVLLAVVDTEGLDTVDHTLSV